MFVTALKEPEGLFFFGEREGSGLTRLEGLESRTELKLLAAGFDCSGDLLCILVLGGGDGDCEGDEIVLLDGDQSEPEVSPRLMEDSVRGGAQTRDFNKSGDLFIFFFFFLVRLFDREEVDDVDDKEELLYFFFLRLFLTEGSEESEESDEFEESVEGDLLFFLSERNAVLSICMACSRFWLSSLLLLLVSLGAGVSSFTLLSVPPEL